jgi:hypothetical protein
MHFLSDKKLVKKKKIPLKQPVRGISQFRVISHLLSRGGITGLSVLAFPYFCGGLQQAVLRRIYTGLHSESHLYSIVYKDTLNSPKRQGTNFAPCLFTFEWVVKQPVCPGKPEYNGERVCHGLTTGRFPIYKDGPWLHPPQGR